MIMKTEHIKNTGQKVNKGQMRKLPGGPMGQIAKRGQIRQLARVAKWAKICKGRHGPVFP